MGRPLAGRSGQSASYNGFTFPDDFTRTESFEAVPIQDDSKRSVSRVEYRIVLVTKITGDATDTTVLDAIRKLSHPGGRFIFRGRGFGDIDIGTRLRDVNWGPMPEVISLDPVGRENAVELKWAVSFSLATCREVTVAGRVMEFNFRVTYDIDRFGSTKRTYAGYVRIPGLRVPGDMTRLQDTADSFRERCVPPGIVGFRRTPGPFELDEAKTTLRFSVVDEEMGYNLPPPGIIDVKASHSYASTAMGLMKWAGTINAEYTLSKDYSFGQVAAAFSRLCKARQRGIVFDSRTQCAVVSSFSCSEPDIYAVVPTMNLTLGYMVVCRLDVLVQNGGLGTRVEPGSQANLWRVWANSMEATLGPRGAAGIIFSTGDDRIIDLCHPQFVTSTLRSNLGFISELRSSFDFPFGRPTPQTSWLDYKNHIRIEVDSGVSVMKRVPSKISEMQGTKAKPGFVGQLHAGVIPPSAILSTAGAGRLENVSVGVAKSANTSVSKRTTDTVFLIMEGHALRAGYEIPVPQLVDVAGVAPIPCNRIDRGEGFACAVIGDVGVPLYGAKWRMRFVLPELPKALPVPPNPIRSNLG